MRNFDKAIEYASKSFEISKKKEILVYSVSAAQILSFSYLVKNKLEIAFDYLRYRDSLYYKMTINDRNALVMDLNEKFEAKQKEQQTFLLQKDNALKNATIKNQHYQVLFLILLCLFAAIGAYIIFRSREKISRVNKVLKTKNDEIQNQHVLLIQAYSKLKELQAFKENLTNMIVHE